MGKTNLRNPLKIKYEGLTAQVYEAIKGEIMDMRLKPGERLTIDALARELGVSTSPIREALARLLSERMVVFKPYSGYLVASLPTKKYLEDLLNTRVLMECHAVRVGAPRMDRALIDELQEAVDGLSHHSLGNRYEDFRIHLALDIKFHNTLIRSSDNEVLSHIYEDLSSLLQLSRRYLYVGKQIDQERVVKEHKEIMIYFVKGDGEGAAEAVRAHLETTRKNLDSLDESAVFEGLPLEAGKTD